MAIRRPAERRATEEEYFALGDSKPYAEYLDGVIVRKAMPNLNHSDLADALHLELGLYARQTGGRAGIEARIRFQSGSAIFHRLPDLCYWAPGRPRGEIRSANPPTLAVEIRSPGESQASQHDKCAFMHEHGVDICWLFDPIARTVEVYEEGETHTLQATGTLASKHLPEFALELGPLFALLDDEPRAGR